MRASVTGLLVSIPLLSSVQIAGVLLLSAVGADGRCLIGSDEDWPANLRKRSHLAGCSRICGLTRSIVPAKGLRYGGAWCKSPPHSYVGYAPAVMATLPLPAARSG
jgi:hypothetical protein